MTSLFVELRKIARQFFGRENIFGYASSEANQMYLLYCFCGKIYFTDKLDSRVKWTWFACVLCEIIVSLAIGIAYTLNYEDYHPLMHLYVGTLLGVCIALSIGLPLLSYCYRRDIEKMIQLVDEYLSSESANVSAVNAERRSTKIHVYFVTLYYLYDLIEFYILFFDALFFFAPEKLLNVVYYTLPIPGIQQYGCLSLFIVANVTMNMMMAFMLFQFGSMISFLILWYVFCFDELAAIRDNLQINLSTFTTDTTPDVMERINALLLPYIRAHQKIISIMELFDGFYLKITTIALFIFNMGPAVVVCLMITTITDSMLKLKCIIVFANVWLTAILICWLGDSLWSVTRSIRNIANSTPTNEVQ